MARPFETSQKVETMRLKAQHLADYLNSEIEISEDGSVDDPYLNDLVHDIEELHEQITP